AGGLQGTSRSIQPQDHLEKEQPPPKPSPSSPQPSSTTSVQRETRENLRSEVCPPGILGIPAGRAALLRQEAIAPQEDSGFPVGEESPAKALEKGSIQPETEEPKPSSQHAGTISSKKATVCPWEVEDEPLPKTEICPWEEAAAPAGKEGLSQDTRGTSKGQDKPGSRGLEDSEAKLAEMGSHQAQRRDTGIFAKLVRKSLESSKAESKKSQSAENIKEEICPWESQGTEKPPEQPPAMSTALPKSPSKKSQSTESLKAEICPWEAQELKSSDKADICPWEVAEPPSGKEKPRQDKEGLS
ncbi:GP179 protein, partial [Xiphorhynchus elegans]|nr:GP179 protein [Xiphorhynchus elegans]